MDNPAALTIEELAPSDKRANEGFSARLRRKESCSFFIIKDVVAAIDGLRSHPHKGK